MPNSLKHQFHFTTFYRKTLKTCSGPLESIIRFQNLPGFNDARGIPAPFYFQSDGPKEVLQHPLNWYS